MREWQRGQAAAERLCGHVLAAEGFKGIDPSHPLGGRDGLKDAKCKRDEKTWIAACFFPRGQESFTAIKDKFASDAKGIEPNKAAGFVFLTNQELTLSERETLKEMLKCDCEILHLERMSRMLNSPSMLGTRLEFLDIEMTKEEQLSFFSTLTSTVQGLTEALTTLAAMQQPGLSKSKPIETVRPKTIISTTVSGFNQPTLHTCEKCKTLYQIDPDFGSIGIPRFGVEQYIECPECDHKEKYHTRWI